MRRILLWSVIGFVVGVALNLVLFSLLDLVYAVGPVYSPATCRLTWTAQTLNADGTPLMDLAAYRMYIGTVPGVYPATPTATIPSPDVAPLANTQITWQCTALTDGQKYANVRGVDFAGNEAALSNEFAFFFDGTAPAAVIGLSGSP